MSKQVGFVNAIHHARIEKKRKTNKNTKVSRLALYHQIMISFVSELQNPKFIIYIIYPKKYCLLIAQTYNELMSRVIFL